MLKNGLMFLDGHLLEVFSVVAEELHFGHAAAKLFVSQSALSQQIKRLEEKVGVALFNRTTRSVSLTPAGELMFRQVKKIGNDTEQMLRKVRQAGRGEGGSLSVGLTPTAACSSLASALHRFRMNRPEIELDLHEQNSIYMPIALRLRTVDVALMRPVTLDADIQLIEAYTEPMVVAMRADDSLSSHAALSLEQINERGLIGYSREISPYFQRLSNELFAQAGLVPNIVQESIIPTLLTLVEVGVGLAVIPVTLAYSRGELLKFIPLSNHDHFRASTMIAFLRGQTNPAVAEFVSMMKKYLKNL